MEHTPSRREFDEFSGDAADFLQPLVNQPGERFQYGASFTTYSFYTFINCYVRRIIGLC